MDAVVTVAGAVISAVFAVAVSWGIFSNELKTHKEEIKTLKEEMKEYVRSSSCQQSHKYTDRDMDAIKTDLRDIKDMLKKLSER